MPLIVNNKPVPGHWAEKQAGNLAALDNASSTRPLRVALVNNMPDAALEETEAQFFQLLDSASGDNPVHLQMFSLTGVPRGDRAQLHLQTHYEPAETLAGRHFDGVIITGTEPRQPDLKKEPYWSHLTDLFSWAEENTYSAVLSCLAAHAAVLHSDAVVRRPLGDKRFGVFPCRKVADHPLLTGVGDSVDFPHSRWNEVTAEGLSREGYSVLTFSPDAGVDLFVKQKADSLFIHFQGHPEYGSHTLLKEYRRDVKRFLRNERETYPAMPFGYFDTESTQALTDFQERACAARTEEIMDQFPEALISRSLDKRWGRTATRIYTNWLQILAAKKYGETPAAAMTRVGR